MTTPEVSLQGAPLQGPVDLQYIEDLIYYDGPLLSLQLDRDTRGPVLTYWLDCDEVRNVWAHVWLAKGDLTQLLQDQVDLLTALRRAARIVVFETRDTAEPLINACEVVPTAMPEDYCPAAGAYLHIGDSFLGGLMTRLRDVGIDG